jgi:hypothetical protein
MKLFDNVYKPIDYIYFRLTRVYFKWDGNGAITALLGTSLFQVLIVFSPILVIIKKMYGGSYLIAHKSIFTVLILVSQIVVLILLHLRYNRIAASLKSKWDNEKEPLKSINGVLVVLALLMPFIIIIVFA